MSQSLSTAGSSLQSYVVHFPEGSGYILIKTLSHGLQGEIYLVRSLTDGKVYVRKHSSFDSFDLIRTPFKHLLPAFVTPTLVEAISQGRDGDVHYYSFCNGGDLGQFIAQCRRNDINISKAWYRSYISQMISILAFIHSGWTPFRIQQDWESIEHGDNWPQNVFLHWPNVDEIFPHSLLGNWDLGSLSKDRTVRNERAFSAARVRYVLSVHQMRDLSRMESTLEEMNYERPKRAPNAAYQAFIDLREQANQANSNSAKEDVVAAQYITERFVPLAAQILARLQAETPIDYRRFKVPLVEEGYTTFSGEKGSDEPSDADFRKWVKTKYAGRALRQTWQWMQVSDVPDDLFRKADQVMRQEGVETDLLVSKKMASTTTLRNTQPLTPTSSTSTAMPSNNKQSSEKRKKKIEKKDKVEGSRVKKSRTAKVKVDKQKASKSRILEVLSPNLQSPPFGLADKLGSSSTKSKAKTTLIAPKQMKGGSSVAKPKRESGVAMVKAKPTVEVAKTDSRSK